MSGWSELSDNPNPPLDVPHHDKPERHQIEKIWGVPRTLPPGMSGVGVSPIPARLDHTHTPAEPLILKFFHSNVLTVSISPADWFEGVDTNLIAYRAFRKVTGGTAVTFTIYNFTTSVQTGTFASGSNDAAATFTGIPFIKRQKISVGLSGFTEPTTSADFSIQLLFEVQ